MHISKSDIRWRWLKDKGFNVLRDDLQYEYILSLWDKDIQAVFCEAKAGTGKTTIAVLAGAYEVEKGNYERIIYVRNAIPLRNPGFLPGTIEEKESPYFMPLIEALDNVHPATYDVWLRENKVLPITTAFTRGITWDNSFIIIDEAQNFDLYELQAVYTRCCDSCKIVTTGSLRQNDNKKIKIYNGMNGFEVYMKHYKDFEGVVYHTLETNYRGKFANHADNVRDSLYIEPV